MAQSLRKHDRLMMDLIQQPEIVYALVGRLYDCYAALLDRFLEIVGPALDILELPGDDFAGNQFPSSAPRSSTSSSRSPTRSSSAASRRAARTSR